MSVPVQTYKQGRLDRVAARAYDAPSTEENSCGDGCADEDSIDIADLRKGGDAPEEIDGGGNDRGRGNEETNLCLVSFWEGSSSCAIYHPTVAALPVHNPPCDLTCCLDDKQTAEALSKLTPALPAVDVYPD